MRYLDVALQALQAEEGGPRVLPSEAEIDCLRALVARLPAIAEDAWPPEAYSTERRFGQSHARLFPLLGRKVRTPQGPGTLLQVFADRVTVVLDSKLSECSFFTPGEVQPFNWQPIDPLQAMLDVTKPRCRGVLKKQMALTNPTFGIRNNGI